MLPPYCKPKLGSLVGGGGFDKAEFNKWQSVLGADFTRIHHYCWALNYVNQSFRHMGARRASLLSKAITDFDYVIERAQPDSYILPEVLVQKAKTLALLGKDVEAARAFARVTQSRPGYALGWAGYADFLADRKQREEALAAVTEGLRYSPDSKLLQRRYTYLGGKLPYPKPLAKTEEARPEQPSPTEAAPRLMTDSAQEMPSPPSAAERAAPSEAEDASGTTPRVPVPSSTKGPYCRFCPDE